MKIQETADGVRISIQAPLATLLSLLVRAGTGELVWDVVHSSFKPVEQPVFSVDPRTGESVEGIVMEVRNVTFTPPSELTPDPDTVPQDSYKTHIVLGHVPAGYRQQHPQSGALPKLESGRSYFVRVWSTDRTERAVFTKR